MAFVGIFKGFAKTNTARRVAAPRQMVLDEGAGEQTPAVDVFRFESIVRTPSNVSFVVHWPTNEANLGYDVFTRPSLGPGAWTWLGSFEAPTNSVSLAVLDGQVADAGTNSPYSGAGFFALGSDTDTDGDGLTDAWESLVHGTSPTNRDTDFDGVSDAFEVESGETDPLNPYSLDPHYPDCIVLRAGRWDPFDFAPSSTNFVWEHIFYAGHVNRPFAYPESSPTTAVLRVSAARGTRGTVSVGDWIVPLFDAPAVDEWFVPIPQPVFQLPIPRGVRQEFALHLVEGTSGDVLFDSDDFAFGELPDGPAGAHGWLVFPDTRASVPCIHDFNARSKLVSLPEGAAEESELTCTWQSAVADVAVSNEPPRAARITANFPASASRAITYTLDHPLHLFGRTTYGQTVRFCPQPVETDAGSLGSGSTPPWLGGGDGGSSDADAGDAERWCCLWGTCCNGDGTCSCGCAGACCPGVGVTDGEDLAEECPQHRVPYEQCASAHFTAYTNAVSSATECPGVLKIREPPDYDFIHLPCPDASVRCCDCPDHGTNYVAVAYKSRRLALVDGRGNDFTRAVEPCTVRVAGVRPSAAVGDATLGFVTNGVAFRTYDYTVLGVGFSKPQGPSLAVYNGLSQTLGVPMTVTTNISYALRLDLLTNVRLPAGNVQFSLEADEGAQFTVWLYDYRLREYWRLLDTQGRTIVNLPLARWRQLVGSSSHADSPVTPIYVTSAAKGAATLRIGYWCVTDSGVVQDWQSQTVTSVNPPLLPDYNRDGRIDGEDVARWGDGECYRYWTNEDSDKGDYVGQYSDRRPNIEIDPSLANVKGHLDLVNLFPIALDLETIGNAWGCRVSYRLRMNADGAGPLRFCFADVPWTCSLSIQTNEVQTVYGELLHSASLLHLDNGFYTIPYSVVFGFSSRAGLLIAEVTERIDWRVLSLEVRLDGKTIFDHELPLQILPVKEMYSWINVRHLSDEVESRPTSYRDREFAKSLVFLHGANVSEAAAEKWGDAVFKRTWLSGLNADFYNVDWRSDIGSSANYHQNASNAFEVAAQLFQAVTNIPGEKVVMAHSLGNMVVSSMIQDHGLQVSKYLMCDSAVPSEAYYPLEDLSIRVPQLEHPDWQEYPTNSWVSNWHKLFRHDLTDDRRLLGWPGRFVDVTQYVVNFYSTGDEVLELATDNNSNMWTGAASGYVQYSWHHQELWKGRGAGNVLGATTWSGWNIEENVFGNNKISAVEAKVMDSRDPSEFKTNTVFYCYPTSMNSTNISLLVRSAHLTQGIPALARPTGATGLVSIVSRSNSYDLNLVNMQSGDTSEGEEEDSVLGIDRPNGWPSRPSWGSRWLHSDMKDVSYFYTFKFFDAVLRKGGLK